MSASEVGLDRRLVAIHEEVPHLNAGVDCSLAHVPHLLLGGFPADSTLIGPHDGEDHVAVERGR